MKSIGFRGKKIIVIMVGTALFMLASAQAFARVDCAYYEHTNRRGRKITLSAGQQIKQLKGFNNKISSVWVRVGHNAVLYKKFRFKKPRLYITSETAREIGGKTHSTNSGTWFNLTQWRNWNDVVSSIKCIRR